MMQIELISLLAFVMVSSFLLLMFVLLSGRKSRLERRLHNLDGRRDDEAPVSTVKDFARSTLPKFASPLVPENEEDRTRFRTRLLHAGLYGRQAMMVFLGVKMVLMVGPAVIAMALGLAGFLPLRQGMIIGVLLGIGGLVGPSFWLDYVKKIRQTNFRRALPDALDVMVICLEGGLSLPGALRKVAGELRTAHRDLAQELHIVEREIELGLSSGEALQHFADRADLEEIRSLAAVIIQAEQYGSSLVRALRVHADTLRLKRLQYAEEMAQKAAVKILFPTVLCIFPGLFIVLLGPAVIQILAALSRFQ